MKEISPFRFKLFSVWHHRSAMKVGVDGVLIGCWTDIGNAQTILDVGTGCGLIALIMAQRQPDAKITAIDIDLPSVDEAARNFENSPWRERLNIVHGGFHEVYQDIEDHGESMGKFDLIISNPPFFNSGITEIHTPRERARHQGDLSPASLLIDSLPILNPGGSVAMVIPSESSLEIENLAQSLGYSLARKCLVRGRADAPVKRALLQWKLASVKDCQNEELTLEISPGIPTSDYRTLCHDFY